MRNIVIMTAAVIGLCSQELKAQGSAPVIFGASRRASSTVIEKKQLAGGISKQRNDLSNEKRMLLKKLNDAQRQETAMERENPQAVNLDARRAAIKESIASTKQDLKGLESRRNAFELDRSNNAPSWDFTEDSTLAKWGINGLGNLNTEALQNVNASGKLSGFFRPRIASKDFLTFNFAANKNASNSDSLLVSTFLFPDAGSNAFSLNTEWTHILLGQNMESGIHMGSVMGEFAIKTIKGAVKDSLSERVAQFVTTNWTLGVRYTYWFKGDNENVSFSAMPLLSVIHVPEKYEASYLELFKVSSLKRTIFNYGVKFIFQYNGLQLFADCRNVAGSKTNIPVTDLRGFNFNIGTVFEADFIERF